MGKIWKIGGREISLASDLPSGVMELQNYRIPSAGILAADSQSRRDAMDLFRAVGGRLPAQANVGLRDVQNKIFETLNSALLRKQIVAFNREAKSGVGSQGGSSAGGGSGGSSSQGAPPATSANGGSNKTSEKTWVDVQLLDENGDPVAGERYILKLTDGSVREGTLGEDGRVRVTGIDPGNCVVTFPDIHTKEWWRKS